MCFEGDGETLAPSSSQPQGEPFCSTMHSNHDGLPYRSNQLQPETSKIVSQNKPCIFVSWLSQVFAVILPHLFVRLSQVFVSSNRKPTSTAGLALSKHSMSRESFSSGRDTFIYSVSKPGTWASTILHSFSLTFHIESITKSFPVTSIS
jgi:hypothetical protein